MYGTQFTKQIVSHIVIEDVNRSVRVSLFRCLKC